MSLLTKPNRQAESMAPVRWRRADAQEPPPLENGDRMSRAEFERRYQLHPEIKKAELVEGVVYVSSPVQTRKHGIPHSHINTWLGVYCAATPGVELSDNSTVRLDLDNEPQPDVTVWIEGGGAYISADDYLEGAPELVVEVAGSSASIDLNDKLDAYRRNGVQEYIVLLTYEQEVRWYTWRSGETEQIQPNAQGVLCSYIFPGLYLPAEHFWQRDLAGVLAVLQEGLDTPEHAEFAKRLTHIEGENQ
ncbi:MAG: Uma2 family endonuclease [Caldilineaceae bacterium]